MKFPQLQGEEFRRGFWIFRMDTEQRLIEAIKQGDAAVADDLIDLEPALVNVRTVEGLSAVLLAVYYGKPDIARMLVKRGAELDIFEASALGDLPRVRELLGKQPELANDYAPDGFQPLGLASFFNNLDVVVYLLLMGAQVNSPSKNPLRVMPLHSSVARKNLTITRILLSHGADVNATQADDFTPLLEAAQNGQLEMVKLLIEFGADPLAVKSDGKSAFNLAQEYEHPEVARYLSEIE
jgi:uncharacterized protein